MKARVGTARWYLEQNQRTINRRNLLAAVLNETACELELLQVDLANGCSVTVAARELTRTLSKIRKVLGDQASGQGDGNVGR